MTSVNPRCNQHPKPVCGKANTSTPKINFKKYIASINSASSNAASGSPACSMKQKSPKDGFKNHPHTAKESSSEIIHGSDAAKNSGSSLKPKIMCIEQNLPDTYQKNGPSAKRIAKKKKLLSKKERKVTCNEQNLPGTSEKTVQINKKVKTSPHGVNFRDSAASSKTLLAETPCTSFAASVKQDPCPIASKIYLSAAQENSSKTIDEGTSGRSPEAMKAKRKKKLLLKMLHGSFSKTGSHACGPIDVNEDEEEKEHAVSEKDVASYSSTLESSDDEQGARICCRFIRIGSFNIHPVDKTPFVVVFVNPTGFTFHVPTVDNVGDNVVVKVASSEILDLLGHFGQCLPVMYVRTSVACGQRICKQLHMEPGCFPYFDPSQKDYKQKFITFAIDHLEESVLLYLRTVFPGDTILKEVDQKTANEILLKSSTTMKRNITFIDLSDDGDTSYEPAHKEAKTSSWENSFPNLNYSMQTVPSSNAASGSSVSSIGQTSRNTVQKNSRKTINGKNALKPLESSKSKKCNISCVDSNLLDCVQKDNEQFCKKEGTSYEPVPKKAKFNPKDVFIHYNASIECVASNAASGSSVSSKKRISSKITSKNHLRIAQQKSSNSSHGSSAVKNLPSSKKCNITRIASNLPDCDRENNEQICKKENTSLCEPIGCSSVPSIETLSGRTASTSSPSSVKQTASKITSTFHLSTSQKKSSNTVDGDIVQKSAASIKTEANQDGTLIDANVKSPAEIIAEIAHVPSHITNNVIRLLNENCTVPFIARYRKELTKDLSAPKIREIQTAYENIKAIQKRVQKIMKTTDSSHMGSSVLSDLGNATTIEEVEAVYAPFKKESRRTFAERAKCLGLRSVAEEILESRKTLCEANLQTLVNPATPAIATIEKVELGVQHIIADTIAKDKELLEMRKQLDKMHIRISSRKSVAAAKKEKVAFVEGEQTDHFKFENYFNFSSSYKNIQCHEVLALNRGESLKILTIKTNIPSYIEAKIFKTCTMKFLRTHDAETSRFLNLCIKYAYSHFIEPSFCRQIRSELTKKATTESIRVFCENLEHLLLAPPMKGEPLIGIDPGFWHGCKIAVISLTGDLLESCVLYPHVKKGKSTSSAGTKLVQLVSRHHVKTIVIGNGTGCRETEAWLSNLIKQGSFPLCDVKYCTVTESGSSVYSVSEEAEKELPGVDPTIRSAVCIAKRLQDPLLEFIKVDPKSLGIGMYQHDVPKAMLKTALSSVMVECASFVGVDVNVCPESVLKKVSGLSSPIAKKIIEWREANGGFVNREQLREVKGLGPKTFEQCAGFIRISPKTAHAVKSFSQKNANKCRADVKFNPLDTTVIHPESYALAEQFLKELNASVDEIGQPSLQAKVIDYFKTSCIESISAKFCATPYEIVTIGDAFKRLQEYDIRSEFEQPLFKSSVLSFNDVKVNAVLTGCVRNVTSFGAFVDIGVGTDGLIHVSKMNGHKVLLGDRVSVRVQSVDISKKRISLFLISAPVRL